MGRPDTVMQSYLSARPHFADLFNGVFFQGTPVISPCDLQEASERYSAPGGAGSNRFRDIKMILKTGETFRVLAVENQDNIDYTMPYRCMQYDVMEYGKQLKELKKHNREHQLLSAPAEKLCGVIRSDRFAPVYTLCLYHGVEPWNGPLSLRDMMDFGGDTDGMSVLFADYPLRLFCVNSTENFEIFHTELRELLHALRYRNDKTRLLKLLEEDQRYSQLAPDTMEAIATMLDIPAILEQKQTNDEKGDHDMCQAIRELREEEREAGRAEGLEKTKLSIVRNMLKRGFSDEDICALAECTVEFIDSVR